MVPMMTLLVSCGVNTGGNGVCEQKVMLHLILVLIDLGNIVVLLITPLVLCDTDANANGII